MPNPTFFHLPEAKRQRLMDAVWQEFTSASYIDASINRIIQAADISRGSFYQYFSGKQDVFSYILQTLMDSGKQMFQAQLTVHNNDLFTAILGMYDIVLWTHTKGRGDPARDRACTLFRLNAELDICQFINLPDRSAMSESTDALLRQTGYRIPSPQQRHALINMLITLILTRATDTLRHPTHEAYNRKMLETQLELIRTGLDTIRMEDGDQ